MGIVNSFPKSWRVSVTVLRSGGRDRSGRPQQEQRILVDDCLIGQRSTAEPDRTIDHPSARLSLYRDPDPAIVFRATDRIEAPDGTIYEVDGKPATWPIGVEVPLKET